MKKINLLFFAPHLSTGGMPQFLLKRIEKLIGFKELEIFVVEFTNLSDEFVVQKNKIKSLVKPENFFTLGENKNELINILKENKIDIIHCDETLESFESGKKVPDELINAIYASDRSWRVVETCHNIWFDPKSHKMFNPDAYAFCTPYHKEVTFSEMDSYSEVIEYPIEDLIPSSNEKKKIRIELGFDNSKIHVINVGLWTRGKNQGEGLEIARKLEKTNPEVQFHFIGNQAGNFYDYWGELMEDVPSNCKIWGERNDVSNFLKASDVFMFNSIVECNPLVLKEAISHGLKIVARDLDQYCGIYTPFISPLVDDLDSNVKTLVSTIKNQRKYKLVGEQTPKYQKENLDFYKKLMKSEPRTDNEFVPVPVISQLFINKPFLEITGRSESEFLVKFFDEAGKCHYENTIGVYNWLKLNREYYTKWTTKVWENGNLIYENTLNLEGKRVYIALGSKSLGDSLGWFPYVEEFRKKHKCHVICSTFKNYLFVEQYPEIEFVEPGEIVRDIYAQYNVGWYYNEDEIDLARHPGNFRNQPMQKTASDILGLDYEEVRPKIKINKKKRERKIGIGIHSTAQSKYWNNPTGWQEVVNYLKSRGWDVVIYSSEGDGYMDNWHPTGCRQFKPKSNVYSETLQEVIDDMSSCQYFIGLGSGLSWLAWAVGLPVVLISGFSETYTEPLSNTWRVINESVCHGCFNSHKLDAGDWNWCPLNKETPRLFECSKSISSKMVIDKICQLEEELNINSEEVIS